jgi:hypothetical protein
MPFLPKEFPSPEERLRVLELPALEETRGQFGHYKYSQSFEYKNKGKQRMFFKKNNKANKNNDKRIIRSMDLPPHCTTD